MPMNVDVIVIGGGQAALAAAIAAREEGARVAIITKGKAGFGGSSVISDGVQSAIFSTGDSPETFFEDMIRGGRNLSNPMLARILAEECTFRVNELESKFGIPLERERKISTPGHSFPRRVYAANGLGKNTTKVLRQYALEIGVELFEQSTLIDLIKVDQVVVGVVVEKAAELHAFYAPSTILATGGFGGLYASTDNPKDVSGEGIGMAWRHGAELVGMEFVQFYPYRLQHPANVDVMTRIFGKGAVLLNEGAERFMADFPRKELETRDILSYEMFKQNDVYLDFSNVSDEDLAKDSPYVYRLVKKGHQGEWKMYPVQHYCMGGIKVDEWGRTSLQGLYACGETSGGLHGANRLGGGSLTEALVFGRRTGTMAAQEGVSVSKAFEIPAFGENTLPNGKELEVSQRLKEIMWNLVGIERTTNSLQRAEKELDLLAAELNEDKGVTALQLQDKVRAAWAAAFAGAMRKESRGAHILQDVRGEQKQWEGNLVIKGKTIEFRQETVSERT
ncbi:FAD-binding protein [Neobacillus rhizophilus]|uniref:L-aspartate oxidase n=1 Tax=Neobacillus rhizophilus TaxID=2833579 RepID=A0A942UAK7_9BACI|nr:FAD-binding protein [Neobacillus rhizophilus]MBS4214579.1 FAD-binding protein [Neobacillus rhizophilus]